MSHMNQIQPTPASQDAPRLAFRVAADLLRYIWGESVHV